MSYAEFLLVLELAIYGVALLFIFVELFADTVGKGLYGSRSKKNRELIAAMKTAAEHASRP